MRPLRIEVEGFSTFRDHTIVDLNGLDLVAFTGQTGSGKSSLIDAMTFALYGSVARYAKENLVAPVIHQLVAEAKVRLDFEVSGKRYAAVRVLRRKTQKDASAPPSATTKEARLENLDSGEVLAGSVKELNVAVVELIGLDFTQFTRTIVLPQGDFADFLNDEPANRQKLLRRLLDMEIYVKMGKAARADAKRAEQQASTLASEQQRNPAPSDEQFAALSARHVALLEAHPIFESTLAEVGTLSVQRQQLLEEHKAAKQKVSRLGTIQVPESLASADQRLQNLQKEQVEARAALDEAEKLLIDQASSEFEDISELGLAIDRLDRLSAIRASDDVAAKSERDLIAAVERLDGLETELAQDRDSTQLSYERAQTTAGASSLVDGLAVGDPCPVCQQTVVAIPDHDPNSELTSAKAASAEAMKAYRTWEKEHSQAKADLKALNRTVEASTAARSELEDQLRSVSSKLSINPELTGADLAGQIERLKVKRDAALAAAEQVKETRSRVEAARGQLATVDRNVEEVESQIQRESLQFSATRDTLADLEPPAVGDESPIKNWQALAEWADQKITEYQQQASLVVEQGHKVAEKLQVKESKISQQAQLLDLTVPGDGLQRLGDALLVATTKVQAEIEQAERRREEAQDREQRIVALRTESELNKSLGGHLDAAGFEGWLLNEALDNIVGKATDRLLQLSGGQYSLLVNDRHFSIIDHNNADERRDVRTLSGGETFLASLGLALALADSIAELAPVDAPRLESMFLDEGFGTLDPETLDVVASAIEELAADGRMIGIVTHVRDLAERLPVRFEVSKGPTTSTVELVEL